MTKTTKAKGGYRQNETGLLVRLDPKRASKVILDAFRKAKTHHGETAKLLDCSTSTLNAWMRVLQLKPTMDEMIEKAKKQGWHHGRSSLSPGRPRKDAEDAA
jgi:hypothetical protein